MLDRTVEIILAIKGRVKFPNVSGRDDYIGRVIDYHVYRCDCPAEYYDIPEIYKILNQVVEEFLCEADNPHLFYREYVRHLQLLAEEEFFNGKTKHIRTTFSIENMCTALCAALHNVWVRDGRQNYLNGFTKEQYQRCIERCGGNA